MSYTLFFSSEWRDKFGALNLLVNSGINFLGVLVFVEIFLCILLCVDLLITLMKPFYLKERLLKFYLLISVLVALFMQVLMLPQWHAKNANIQYVAVTLLWLIVIFYIGIVFFSIIYACIKLSKPGISSEVRKLVLLRHVITMLTFLVVNFYKFFGACIAFMPRWNGEIPEIDNSFIRIAKVVSNM